MKWPRQELKLMDQRARKLMTMHKALHPIYDVDRLFVSRKEGGKGLASIEDSIDESIQKRGERLITVTRNNSDKTRNNKTTITRKQKWGKNNCMNVLSD